MKKILNFRFVIVLLSTAIAPLGAMANTFFSDTFTGGSTVNQSPTTSAPGSASYQSAVGLATPSNSISPNNLVLQLTNTSSLLGEYLALFTNSPIGLASTNDNVEIDITFVNQSNILSGFDTANSSLDIGLFNSGGVAPNQGNIVTSTGNTTGGTQNWIGYVGGIFWGGSSKLITRPAQTPSGTSSQNQDLLFSGASSSQAFNSPSGGSLGTTPSSVLLTNGSTYTVQFVITLTAASTYSVSNALYSGVGTGTTPIFSQVKTASGATFLTTSFDGMAIGWRNASSASQYSIMDITSIQVIGQSTAASGPPTITSQPTPVSVATNGAGAFLVTANGLNVTYQWHRNGTNLIDGGNISGSTTPTLLISPAGTADALSGANGYYVTVSGQGGYSTNSVTNSLALIQATNLIWSGSSATWDVNTTADWQDTNGNASVFNYGDPVTFDDTPGSGGIRAVNLTGNFLSAASVTVNSSFKYTFQGTGSFAGPGSLIYKGSNQLDIKNANTYTGGTLISNSSAYVFLENLAGLGTGPVTLAMGGQMEISVAGSAASGINGNVTVADDFTITFDSVGTFAGVFFGNLSGTAGKTLSLEPTFSSPFTNSRVRFYGVNTVYNGNLFIDGPATSQAQYSGFVMAAYGPSGSQTYNGVISGNGGFISRDSGGTTIFNGENTYAGGTTPSAGNIGFGTNTIGAVTSGPIGTGPLNLAPEVPNLNGSGTVFAFGGPRTIANPIQYPSGTNNQLLIIGGTNNLTFSGSYTLNGIDGLGSPTNRTLQVTNTGLTILSGVISDGGTGYGFIKAGNGVLAFNNTETYTGPTAVSAGTLQVNGQLAAASVVTVSSNAVLAGTGTINGVVTNSAGGILAPGAGSIGTLTINNNLTLAGNALFKINKSVSPSNDLAVVTGTLINTGTGTVTVTNLGPTLVTGDKFTLFSKAVANGNTLIVTGAGVNWANNLAADGSISVSSTVATNPTNITFSVNGNVLTLSWPADHTGWHLQAQTNSLAKGLGTNWFEVVGSTSANSNNVIINPTNGAVFYRLVSP